jgi:hypothetical protein
VAHTAWHWTSERWEQFRRFDVPVPTFPPAVDALPWVMLALGAAAVVWLISVTIGGRGKQPEAVDYGPNAGPVHEGHQTADCRLQIADRRIDD